MEKGSFVKFINKEAHGEFPEWYPAVGTIGRITGVTEESY
jgi:hypothetical protein